MVLRRVTRSGCLLRPLLCCIRPLSCLHQTIYKPSTTRCAVSKGSVLDPLLFVMYTTQHLLSHHHPLLETSASYLMNASLFPTRSHLFPNLAITISVSFAVSVHTSIPKQLPSLPLPLFTPSSTTATLFITTCPVSDHPAPTDPELSCTCCCQSSQIQSHHSHPPVSTLAKDN